MIKRMNETTTRTIQQPHHNSTHRNQQPSRSSDGCDHSSHEFKHYVIILFIITAFLFLEFTSSHTVTGRVIQTTTTTTTTATTTATTTTTMTTMTLDLNQTTSMTRVMDQFLYPIQECLTLAPMNQFYYPFLYTFDTDYWDFCSIDQPKKVPPEIYKLGSLYQNDSTLFSCENILCHSERRWDLTNQTQVVSLGVLFNYCLHCNNPSSEQFRQTISNNSCPSFSTSVNSTIQSPTFLSKFNYITDYHCNYGMERPSKHLGLLNHNFHI